MSYVDGYVLPVPTKNLAKYRRIASMAGRVWKDHGALEYRECAGEDLAQKWGVPFPKMMNLKRGETVVFSWIVFKSRKHRDQVNAKVMKDPRMSKEAMEHAMGVFDHKRMVYGGFETLVDA